MALLVGAIAAPAGVAAQAASQMFVVVRHAEKASETARDPDLSATGHARAAALDSALAAMPVSAIVVSPFQRTRQTAAVVAARHALTPIEVPIGREGVPAHARAVAAEARRHGGTVLIVGHSNTVGAIVAALGGDPTIGDLDDSDYRSLFVVVPSGDAVGTIRVQYGAH